MTILSQFLKDEVCLDGQVPTTLLFPEKRYWHFDDESTMLAMIWRAKLLDLGVEMLPEERKEWSQKWSWITRHVGLGSYLSPEGTGRSWLDTFRFRQEDTIGYVQGICAVSLLAAQKIFSIDEGKVKKAVERAVMSCERLAERTGWLPLSCHYPYLDRSVLFGEFLSLMLFNQPLLPEEIIKKTIESFPEDSSGRPVILRQDGSYPPAENFLKPNKKRVYEEGEYQRGGDWPLFTALVQYVGEKRDLIPHHPSFWLDLIENLEIAGQPEYFFTGEKREKDHDPQQRNHLWNSAIYRMAEEVLSRGGKQAVLDFRQSQKGSNPFTSEVSQRFGF